MEHEDLFVGWETKIDEWGFTNISVGGADQPDHTYTAGLFHHDHPEFGIVGAPPQLAHGLLWDLASAVVRSGMRFGHGTVVHRLASGPMGIVAADDRPDDLVAVADRLRRRAGVSGSSDVLQVVFPDPEGVLPWGRVDDHLGFPVFTRPRPVSLREIDLPDRAARDADGWYVDP